ncbi:Clavaminate synthase-like protein [Punctularia strigosozonata HHB-11173 SS5]|uniref:Clavaminate synthase-like protein n=1 Tax=Punctularia strigosozonata (strain HHB-11173) TaxID=741275 RepID=UPI000441632B|nr:Clavaminate synthase-like protein [Punctularia strigosozonata HHB-11173 SS5]EIN10878.1 Clavaminate synthase-like protein [Punctularia strigosozonata HHB-11173 SS5]
MACPVICCSLLQIHKVITVRERSQIANAIVDACRQVGFVYIIGHGIDAATLEAAFAIAKRLFDLPIEDKMKAPHPSGGAVHRGYSYPGLEKVSQETNASVDVISSLRQVKDIKESYEIGSDNDDEQPNIWLPEEVLPCFRSLTTDLYWKCFEIAKDILRLLARGLGLEDEDYFVKLHSGNYNQLRLLHYPPVPAGDIESHKSSRMPAHTDWCTMTMLFQDDCGGLEVEVPNNPGVFVPAPPIKDALIMNVGDLLMRWSNDYLKSIHHRVGLPPTDFGDRFTGPDRMTRARYSIPYFVAPDPRTLVECLSCGASQTTPAKYPPITWQDYRLMRAATQY